MVVLPVRRKERRSARRGSIRLMEKPVSNISQTELVPLIWAGMTRRSPLNSRGIFTLVRWACGGALEFVSA